MRRWQGIEEYLAVVEQNSFSGAAKKLGISVASVSLKIKALEQRLGVRLLLRSSRNITVTDTGKVFFENCLQMREEYLEAQRELEQWREEDHQLLRVHLSQSIDTSLFTRHLMTFAAEANNLKLQVEDARGEIDTLANDYDVSISMLPIANNSYQQFSLFTDNWVICGSPQYFTNNSCPITPEDLLDHPCIVGSIPWQYGATDYPQINQIQSRITVENGTDQIQAALAGIGLIQRPYHQLKNHLETGSLRIIDQPWAVIEADVVLLFPLSKTPPTVIRQLNEFLSASLAGVARA